MDEKDIAIIIKYDSSPFYSWMTYASWYSISRNISQATIHLCPENKDTRPFWQDIGPFWHRSCKVDIIKNQNKIERPIIKIIDPSVVAIRNFEGNLDISSSKSDVFTCLVDYKFGCGDFILDQWINNNNKAPFENAIKNFSNYNMTINEMGVLKIWEQCLISYRALGGVC